MGGSSSYTYLTTGAYVPQESGTVSRTSTPSARSCTEAPPYDDASAATAAAAASASVASARNEKQRVAADDGDCRGRSASRKDGARARRYPPWACLPVPAPAAGGPAEKAAAK